MLTISFWKSIVRRASNQTYIVTIIIALLLIFSLVLAFYSADQDNEKTGELQQNSESGPSEAVASNLYVPWDMEFLPDGRMVFTERSGHAYLLDGDNKIDLGLIEGTAQVGEGGLLGVAVDPEFSENNHLYFYYTYYRGRDLRNGVVRLRLDGEQLLDEVHLLDIIPANNIHNGGALGFGPDGKLYFGTGDAGNPALSQDTNSLAGKILRLNKDGSIPEDNPFGNPVWVYGLRNPQGLAWHPTTGSLFATEHGPNRMDEINIIERGGNYGWPNYQCTRQVGASLSNITFPIACYDSFTLAPSGLAFSDTRTLYIGGLRGQQLRRINLSDEFQTVLNQEELFTEYGRIRAVAEREGSIYFSTSNTDGRGTPRTGDDQIVRVDR